MVRVKRDNLPVAVTALSLKIQNYAAELRLRSERRLGELLGDLAPHGGKRTPSSQHGNLTLDGLGINANQSSRWRREAAVPETVFLHYLAAANEREREITAQGLLRLERMLGSEAAPGTKPATNRRRRGETLDSEQISGKFTLRRSSAGDEEIPTESIGELLVEIVNHLDLLASILMPVCEGADSPLKSAERRLIARLVPEIGELVRRLERTLPRDSDRQ